jgi:hypothetical protein
MLIWWAAVVLLFLMPLLQGRTPRLPDFRPVALPPTFCSTVEPNSSAFEPAEFPMVGPCCPSWLEVPGHGPQDTAWWVHLPALTGLVLCTQSQLSWESVCYADRRWVNWNFRGRNSLNLYRSPVCHTMSNAWDRYKNAAEWYCLLFHSIKL